MKHTSRTSQFTMHEEGHYVFTVKSVPEKKRTAKDKFFFIWEIESNVSKTKIVIFEWAIGDLLRALGFQENEPDVFEWDDEQVVGKSFEADLIHEIGNDNKTREKLENIVSVLQKEEQPQPNVKPEDVVWDE